MILVTGKHTNTGAAMQFGIGIVFESTSAP